MKNMLLMFGLCFIFSLGAFAQHKDNKAKMASDSLQVDTSAVQVLGYGRMTQDSIAHILKMYSDNIKADTDSVQIRGYGRGRMPQDDQGLVPIPNAMNVKDPSWNHNAVQIPNKVLTGQENVVMPGTEALGEQKNTTAPMRIRPLERQDSLRTEVKPKEKK